jgi:hypothetical protein
MRHIFSIYAALLFSAGLSAQTLSKPNAVTFTDLARSRYYNLRDHGFESFTCDVKPDWDTLPKMLLVPVELAGRKPLEATKLQVTLTSRGNISFNRQYPEDTASLMKPAYDKFFDWLSSLVQGFLMTWGSKAVSGIIPDKYLLSSVEITPQGHRIIANIHDEHIELSLDPDYRVTDFLQTAPSLKITEQPVFNKSSEGWLLAGDSGVDAEGNNVTRIKYEVAYLPIDTLQLPRDVHLVVNDDIDIKFSFENCTAIHGMVLQVSPSPSTHTAH